MINTKGISPLIATVLLIGFTIVAAVLVITWINTLIGSQTDTQACKSTALDKCISTTGSFTYGYTGARSTSDVVATVFNGGTKDATFRVAYLDTNGNAATNCVAGPSTAASFTTASFAALPACDEGTIYKLRFVQEVTATAETTSCTETCGSGVTIEVTS